MRVYGTCGARKGHKGVSLERGETFSLVLWENGDITPACTADLVLLPFPDSQEEDSLNDLIVLHEYA